MRKEYDFSEAKRANEVPHLAKLQAEGKGKTRITIMLDNDVIQKFRTRARREGLGYQTLINQVLKNETDFSLTEETLRKIIREELAKAS